MSRPSIPAHIREQQINELTNIRFVRWSDEYRNNTSKATVRCIAGHEWSASVLSLLNCGNGCPQCSGKRRWTAEERIQQIGARHGITFIGWADGYAGKTSIAICRCAVDGHEWGTSVDSLLNHGTGCPKCAVKRTTIPAHVREQQINNTTGISFVRWVGRYKNVYSKAVCRCSAGHEWSASVDNLLHKGNGCPSCAKHGYDQTKAGTLYFLRSECGTMVKIGVSNNHVQRHRILKRETPFGWACIELIHGSGRLIAELEKYLHDNTEQVMFPEAFNGYTEWRKWAPEVPRLMREARIAAGVAPQLVSG